LAESQFGDSSSFFLVGPKILAWVSVRATIFSTFPALSNLVIKSGQNGLVKGLKTLKLAHFFPYFSPGGLLCSANCPTSQVSFFLLITPGYFILAANSLAISLNFES
jgi:hypothetical protein